MNLRLERKNIMLLLAAILLASFMYTGAYFLYISPLKNSLTLKESQLKSEQQLSETLAARLVSSTQDLESTVELQEMLPVDPMIEQLLLDLEKAEVVSNSYITSMEFDKAEAEAETATAEIQTNETEAQGTESVTGEDTTNSSVPMPDGMAKASVTITVESDNYFDIERFIETIENLKRVVMVDSISFSGPEEIKSMSDESSPIVMSLTINSFYLSGLDDLKDNNPKIETPVPANKRNPFPTFGDYSDENLKEDQSPQVEEDLQSEESITEEDSTGQ